MFILITDEISILLHFVIISEHFNLILLVVPLDGTFVPSSVLIPDLNFSIVYKPILSKRHLELASRWTPSAITYGVTAGLGLLYFTDWKAVVRYIPFYGGKFKE
ncbi:hypothetical protein KPH14_004917 [Odynerus spinipes]|uniref:Cytochrome b-c1 complex subunit 10 n=1 Tax=Odynerus spinipes TaxID=1348599 RepID=A0AAD9VQS5_9HYME|nr:hypothetical protein KPH14_004917 [Odynerus spinipes]